MKNEIKSQPFPAKDLLTKTDEVVVGNTAERVAHARKRKIKEVAIDKDAKAQLAEALPMTVAPHDKKTGDHLIEATGSHPSSHSLSFLRQDEYNKYEDLYNEYKSYCSDPCIKMIEELPFPNNLMNCSEDQLRKQGASAHKIFLHCDYIQEYLGKDMNISKILNDISCKMVAAESQKVKCLVLKHIFFGLPVTFDNDLNILMDAFVESSSFYPMLAILKQNFRQEGTANAPQQLGRTFQRRLTYTVESVQSGKRNERIKKAMDTFWSFIYFVLSKQSIDTLKENVFVRGFGHDFFNGVGPFRGMSDFFSLSVSDLPLYEDCITKPNCELWRIFRKKLFQPDKEYGPKQSAIDRLCGAFSNIKKPRVTDHI